MKCTIWIINEAGHDYDKALDLIEDADLRPLTLGNINPLRVDRLTATLARGITRFVKKEDYALIAGTPVLNAIAITLWILHHGECNILQWNAKNKEYELSTLSREHMGRLLEKEMTR